MFMFAFNVHDYLRSESRCTLYMADNASMWGTEVVTSSARVVVCHIELRINVSRTNPTNSDPTTYDALFELGAGIDDTLIHYLRDDLRQMSSGCTVYRVLYDLLVPWWMIDIRLKRVAP